MGFGDWLGIVSLVLVVVGLGLTWLVYQLERAAAEQHDIETARGLLRGVQAGMKQWGDAYFQQGWVGSAVLDRAQEDYALVMDGSYGHIFEVPREPIAALVSGVTAGQWISDETVAAAGVALWKIGLFNELVRQKTDFNGRHLVEIYDPCLDQQRREAVAKAAKAQSQMLHADAIGDGEWYRGFKDQIAANVESLDAALRERSRWTRLRRVYGRLSLP